MSLAQINPEANNFYFIEMTHLVSTHLTKSSADAWLLLQRFKGLQRRKQRPHLMRRTRRDRACFKV